MKTLGLREAKEALSAIVEAAERGEPTTITKRGRPAAMVVPVDTSQRRHDTGQPTFVDLLRAIPCSVDIDRNPSRPRDIDL